MKTPFTLTPRFDELSDGKTVDQKVFEPFAELRNQRVAMEQLQEQVLASLQEEVGQVGKREPASNALMAPAGISTAVEEATNNVPRGGTKKRDRGRPKVIGLLLNRTLFVTEFELLSKFTSVKEAVIEISERYSMHKATVYRAIEEVRQALSQKR